MPPDVQHPEFQIDDGTHNDCLPPPGVLRSFRDLNALLNEIRLKLGTNCPERYLSVQHMGVDRTNYT